jgi:hypothetical protein
MRRFKCESRRMAKAHLTRWAKKVVCHVSSKMLSALISIVFVLGLLKNYIHLLWTFKNNVFIKVSEHSKSEITNAVLKSSSENYSSFWLHSLFGCQTTRTISEDKSARKRGLVGPYITTRTVLLFYNIAQYLYLLHNDFI